MICRPYCVFSGLTSVFVASLWGRGGLMTFWLACTSPRVFLPTVPAFVGYTFGCRQQQLFSFTSITIETTQQQCLSEDGWPTDGPGGLQILWDACVALKEESTLLQAARFGLNLKLFLVPQLAISSSAGLQRDGLETLFAPHLMKNHVQNPPTLEGFATCGFRKKVEWWFKWLLAPAAQEISKLHTWGCSRLTVQDVVAEVSCVKQFFKLVNLMPELASFSQPTTSDRVKPAHVQIGNCGTWRRCISLGAWQPHDRRFQASRHI